LKKKKTIYVELIALSLCTSSNLDSCESSC